MVWGWSGVRHMAALIDSVTLTVAVRSPGAASARGAAEGPIATVGAAALRFGLRMVGIPSTSTHAPAAQHGPQDDCPVPSLSPGE